MKEKGSYLLLICSYLRGALVTGGKYSLSTGFGVVFGGGGGGGAKRKILTFISKISYSA